MQALASSFSCLFPQPLRKRLWWESVQPPRPVAATHDAGRVDAGVGTEFQKISNRDECGIALGMERRPHELTDGGNRPKRFSEGCPFFVRQLRPPHPERRHVVGAGIANAVFWIDSRMVELRQRFSEPELDDPHAGEGERVAQAVDCRGEFAEILGDDAAERNYSLYLPKQFFSGDAFPMSAPCVWTSGRDRPHRMKAAKVVEAHFVVPVQGGSQPFRPPGKSDPLQSAPVVERVAPDLAVFIKHVGRCSRNRSHGAVAPDAKEMTVCPDIHTVMGDAVRQITDDPNAVLACIPSHRIPLLARQPLSERVVVQPSGLLATPADQRTWVPIAERNRPVPPWFAMVDVLGRDESTVVVEPPTLRRPKAVETPSFCQ